MDRIIPLGGADEVGASAYILEVAGARLLIDAGIRPSAAGRAQPLPALDLIAPGSVDAVLVTHGHTDHTGALPLLPARLGDAPIHMTIGTLRLIELLQLDAVRHLTAGDDDDRELDPKARGFSYTEKDVGEMVARVVPHPFYQKFCPVPGRTDIQVELVPAGHVMGAAMLVIDTERLRIGWSGDVSVEPQPTIGGADVDRIEALSKERRFDLWVTEGTYGVAKHPPREREHRKLIKALERATHKGGLALIPAFAVGRSQDIGVVIRQAKLQGRLKDVSVYFDGMTRGATAIYQDVAHHVYPGLQEPIQILDPDLGIYKVNGQSRAKLSSGDASGPAIIIASSGMLIGGRSPEWAKVIAPDRKGAILISGYSDEDSPARAIQKLRRGGLLRLGDLGTVRVKAFVGAYHLSAHADFPQLKRLVDAANPRKIALVHGESPVLTKLAERLGKRASVLHKGETYELHSGRRVWTLAVPEASDFERLVAGHEAVGDFRARGSVGRPDATAVRQLWSVLVEAGDRSFSEAEIARMFLGHAYNPGERDSLSRMIADHRLYFITGSSTGQRSFRPRPKDEVRDLLIERSNAYQIPLKKGDVVAYTDGATDVFVAAIVNTNGGDEVDAVVAGSSRKTIRREWIRAVAGFSAERMVSGHLGACARWLEDLVRDARAFPGINAVECYYAALKADDHSVSVPEAAEALFPSHRGDHPEAALLGVAMSIAGSAAMFAVRPDGRIQAREEAEVAARWPAFPAVRWIRSLPEGAAVELTTGQVVHLTGEWSSSGFEAVTSDGRLFKCHYRKVMLPEEGRQPL